MVVERNEQQNSQHSHDPCLYCDRLFLVRHQHRKFMALECSSERFTNPSQITRRSLIQKIIVLQVPFSTLHASHNSTVPASLRHLHGKVSHLHLANEYGLFRRMTGVGGRPEIIIEGSNNIDGPWKEYEFLYKPGNVNSTLWFVGKTFFYFSKYV